MRTRRIQLAALLLLLVASCKDGDTAVGPGATPTIMLTKGILLTMGINGIGQHDTLVFRIGRGGTVTLTSFEWWILDDHDGFIKWDNDRWDMVATGSGSDIHRITRPGTGTTIFAWDGSWDGVQQKEVYHLVTRKDVSDSTDFHSHPLDNGHFTIEPVSLPGCYLNAEHDYSAGSSTEFIQGKPQEFWFEPWE
jgi:hypothetical protein